MKKLLLSSIVLTLFSFSIILFQLSCKKDAVAQTGTAGLTQLNKIVYSVEPVSNITEIWTANYDGTNKTKINITLPSATIEIGGSPKLSPDGQKVFFEVNDVDPGTGKSYIYSANINGSNVALVIDGSAATVSGVELGAAY